MDIYLFSLIFGCFCLFIIYLINETSTSTFIEYKQSYLNSPPINKFLIQYRGNTNYCIDDNGINSESTGNLKSYTCDPNNNNQQFTYDPTTMLLSNPNKKNLCIDDNDTINVNKDNNLSSKTCIKKDNYNQAFIYNQDSNQIMSANKYGLCVDSKSAVNDNGVKLYLNNCGGNGSVTNQGFNLLDVSLHGKKFIIKNKLKDNLCMHSGGTLNNASYSTTCSNTNSNLQFKYDVINKLLMKANDNTLCLDDRGVNSPDLNKTLYLSTCNANNRNQHFVYNEAKEMWYNPNKNLCIDDTAAVENNGTNLYLNTCNNDNINQKFTNVTL